MSFAFEVRLHIGLFAMNPIFSSFKYTPIEPLVDLLSCSFISLNFVPCLNSLSLCPLIVIVINSSLGYLFMSFCCLNFNLAFSLFNVVSSISINILHMNFLEDI